MDTTNDIDKWLSTVERAGLLEQNQFQVWMFIVGTSGTLSERIALGEKALELFKTKPVNVRVNVKRE